jgi:hypothetical protein
MRVRRDDGVVVYINGTEVHRDNMPTGTITYQTVAPLNMDAQDELTYFPAPPIPSSVLVPGTNVIAVELHQKSGGSSDISFDLELSASISVLPPVIVVQPSPQSILEGQNAAFEVTAIGTPPFRYQWRFNGAPITGATNSILTITAAQPSAAGGYSAVVSNAAGGVTSESASLAVERIRGVSLVGETVTALAGQEVVVPIRVTGFTNVSLFQFSLQWNPAVATFVGVEQLGFTNTSFGTTETNNGRIAVSWDDIEGTSKTLAAGSTLMALRLRLVGTPGTSTALSIANSPVSIEVADHNLEMVPVAVAHGQINVAVPAGSPPVAVQPTMGIALIEGSVALWWDATAGKRYRLQGCDDLSTAAWIDLGEIVASGDIASAVDAGPLFGQRLYRVLIVSE